MAELLKIDNLFAGYGETVVIEGLSLSLADGEAISVLGRNGVGKSTLLNTVLGLTTQHSGSLHYLGKRYWQSAQPRACCFGSGSGAPRARNFPVVNGA